jgi:hypothetical protein
VSEAESGPKGTDETAKSELPLEVSSNVRDTGLSDAVWDLLLETLGTPNAKVHEDH